MNKLKTSECVNCKKIMKQDNVHHCHHGTFCSLGCKNIWHVNNRAQRQEQIKELVIARIKQMPDNLRLSIG